MGYRVFRDLTKNVRSRLEKLFDPRASVVAALGFDVTSVEHRVLGSRDIDKSGFHAGQDVLHPAEIDVAVNLRDVVGWTRHVMLDQVAPFENSDLCCFVSHRDTHQVTPRGLALALSALSKCERLFVELDGVTRERCHRLRSVVVSATAATAAASTTPTPALLATVATVATLLLTILLAILLAVVGATRVVLAAASAATSSTLGAAFAI